MRTHQEVDEQSLALHQLVVAKIRANPALLGKAEETLKRWRQTVSPRTLPYLDEWQSLIDRGMEVCLAMATEQSQRADALRQSSPLSCLLSHKERFEFLASRRRSRETQ